MLILEEIVRQQPYPCFRLSSVPPSLKNQLKKGMLCLYNIDRHSLEFPTVGRLEPAENLLPYLDFIGYYSLEDFRDVVLAGVLPVNCPSCKGPVENAGIITFEVEEPDTTDVGFVNGDAELFVCRFCRRPFALMPNP
jgi:hypothetical protein